LTLLVFSYDL